MGKVIRFSKLKIGEIISIEIKGQLHKCKIIEHMDKEIYKIKVLHGPAQGQTAILHITGWEKESLGIT